MATDEKQKSKTPLGVWIVLGVFGVVAIGSLILPEQQVDMPTATSSGPSTPESPTPQPVTISSPPAPAASPSPVAIKTLGVNRSAVQSVFEKPSIGFVFKEATPVNGQSRISGVSPNKITYLELIGSPELSQASILTGVVSDQTQNELNAIYTVGFLKTVLPNWEGSDEWVAQEIDRIMKTDDTESSISQDGKQIKLSIAKSVNLITLSVKPLQ